MTASAVSEIRIGTPVAGTEVIVVDEAGNAADEGELLALGDGLALGYLNDPDKTARSFVDLAGRRAYRTGDFVARGPDGRLAYRGRIDSQVKVSGYRIDLQEVEHAFLECGAGTAKAFVDDGRVQLAVTEGGDSLREAAADFLPGYMQPQQIHLVDVIPTKPNGKVDLPALKALIERRLAGPSATSVRTVIAEQLGVAVHAEDDDLFVLGADSIAIWTLVAAINDEFGTELTLFDVLLDPRISSLEAATQQVAPPSAAA